MFISTAHAAYDIYRYDVFVGPDDQTTPDIDGDSVAWVGSDDNIYWKQMDQSTASMISTGGIQTDPKISGNVVVWYDNGTYRNVYGYDLQEDQFLYITDNSIKQWQPDISDSIVVWEESTNIYSYHISQDVYQTVCDESTGQYRPAIDGNTVVWMDTRDGGYQIYMSDISGIPPYTSVRVGTSGLAQWDPDISGDWIVWEEQTGPGFTIAVVAYNKQTAATWSHTIESATTAIHSYPRVSNGIVVWQDPTDGSIQAKDLNDMASAVFEVSDGFGINQYPAVFVDPVSDRKTIVWQRKTGLHFDIAAADLLVPTEIDLTGPNGGESFIAGGSMLIEWTTTGPVDEVLIEFSSNGGTNWVGVNTVDNTGSYLWAPAADADSDACLVKITNTANPNVFDISAAFAVHPIPDAIAVLSPNGGEMILAGGEMLITWGLVSGIAPAAVNITFDDNINAPTVIAEDVPFDDYQHLWAEVTDVNSLNACSIQISDAADGDPADVSDAAFSVFQCDVALTADLTGDCFVNLADVAELARQWLTCGNPHDDTWCLLN
jgi:beta propeller repeat protein